jgi:hypothetical protein
MIRLTLLQFRAQAVTAAAALAAFAILLAATGPHLASLYAISGLSGCQPASCAHLASDWLSQLYFAGTYWVLYLLGVLLILLTPAVIGLFWGAPLIARELETGTSALAWNQSVTRTRWLAVKLTVGGLAAMAVTEGLSLMQAWWAAPIGRAVGLGGGGTNLAMGRFSSLVFATHGITPLGYAAFGFTLGATAGALIRRTVPAMAVTLAIFAAVQIAMPLWVRPNLFPAEHTVLPVSSLQQISLQQGGFATAALTSAPRTSPASPAPGSCQAEPSTPPGRRPAPPRPPAPRDRCETAPRASLTAWPATASGKRSATSPPADTGLSSGPRPGSTSPWPWP